MSRLPQVNYRKVISALKRAGLGVRKDGPCEEERGAILYIYATQRSIYYG